MKRFIQFAALMLLTTTQIFSTELLKNSDFVSDLSWWSTSTTGTTTITAKQNGVYGYEAYFTFGSSYSGTLFQSGLTLAPGSYKILLGGNSLVNTPTSNAKTVTFGFKDKNGVVIHSTVVSINEYSEKGLIWENDLTYTNASFFIYVTGTNSTGFKISWASVDYKVKCGTGTGSTAVVRLNQVAYLSEGVKKAVILKSSGAPVDICSGTNLITSVTPTAASTWTGSGETGSQIDFSFITSPGTYALHQGGVQISNDFKISATPYASALNASLKFFYYQRSSMDLSNSQYAGIWTRSAGTMDHVVKFHNSSNGNNSTSGYSLLISKPSSKGWYDAGDYGKYIVNSGITTYTLMSLYEHYSDFFATRSLNIPESENDSPDILDEIRWNLDWMLSMQAADGGVYHKLTELDFPAMTEMPSDMYADRFIIGKSTAASFDFAAVMAQASRIYKVIDPTFAATCLDAARKAYTWAIDNPNNHFKKNPSDVKTGEYKDSITTDEMFWASVEMALATNGIEEGYKTNALASIQSATTPNWGDVRTLGFYSMMLRGDIFGTNSEAARDSLLKVADALLAVSNANFYGVSMKNVDFVWGSNAVIANQGIVLLHAYYMTKDKAYLNAAATNLNYLLGNNPLNLSFLTGYGTKTALDPHHRPSYADLIVPPIPGMLIGGPHLGMDDYKAGHSVNYSTGYPATSYLDDQSSYATNEVAINWNAAFAYLVGAIEALGEGQSMPNVVDPNGNSTAIPLSNDLAKPSIKTRLVFNGNNLEIHKTSSNGIKRFDLKGQLITSSAVE